MDIDNMYSIQCKLDDALTSVRNASEQRINDHRQYCMSISDALDQFIDDVFSACQNEIGSTEKSPKKY